jgi:hypothetical protein
MSQFHWGPRKTPLPGRKPLLTVSGAAVGLPGLRNTTRLREIFLATRPLAY